MGAGLRVTGVDGLPVVVAITRASDGAALNVYADPACTAQLTMPVSVTTDTTFFMRGQGAVSVSLKIGGVEVGPVPATSAEGAVSSVPVPGDPDTLKRLQASDTSLRNPLARTVEGIPWFLAGHSHGAVPPFGGTASAGGVWITRLATELAPYSLVNASVSGYMAADVAGRVLGTTQPFGANFKGLVFIDVGTNDMNASMTAKRVAGITLSVKAMIAGAQAQSKVVESDASFVYTGTWTVQANAEYGSGASKSSQTSGDKVTITLPSLAAGLNYTLLLTSCDSTKLAGCTSVQVKLDGVVTSTINLNDQMQFTNTSGATLESFGVGFYPLTIPGNGTSRTLVLTSQAAGYFGVDDLLIPQANPPQVVLLGQPAFTASYSALGGDTSLGIVNAAIQAGAVGFTGTTYVDLNAGYVPATMCSSVDGLHANDLGHAQRAASVAAALQSLAYRSGINVL